MISVRAGGFKAVLAFTLYLLAITVLLPFLPLRLLWRSLRAPAYRHRMLERFGFSDIRPASGGIWVHAVSVGEVIAAVPMIKTLQASYPQLPITVTTTTPTGSERVTELLGESVDHVYMPYDWPPLVALFLRRVKPSIHITMETELWPVSFPW